MSQSGFEKALAKIRAALRRIEARLAAADDGRRRRGLETHTAILTAAREIFVAEGYAGLTLGKVAARCGANKGNIAYYFPTKSELLQVMLLHELAQYLAANIEHVEGHADSPETALLALTEQYVKDARITFQFLMQTWGFIASDNDARKMYAEIYIVFIDFLGSLLRAASPRLSKSKAEIAALEIMQAVEGLTVHYGMKMVNDRTMRTLEKKAMERIKSIIASSK